jgi:hypothetical protein
MARSGYCVDSSLVLPQTGHVGGFLENIFATSFAEKNLSSFSRWLALGNRR